VGNLINVEMLLASQEGLCSVEAVLSIVLLDGLRKTTQLVGVVSGLLTDCGLLNIHSMYFVIGLVGPTHSQRYLKYSWLWGGGGGGGIFL